MAVSTIRWTKLSTGGKKTGVEKLLVSDPKRRRKLYPIIIPFHYCWLYGTVSSLSPSLVFTTKISYYVLPRSKAFYPRFQHLAQFLYHPLIEKSPSLVGGALMKKYRISLSAPLQLFYYVLSQCARCSSSKAQFKSEPYWQYPLEFIEPCCIIWKMSTWVFRAGSDTNSSLIIYQLTAARSLSFANSVIYSPLSSHKIEQPFITTLIIPYEDSLVSTHSLVIQV